MNTHELKLWPIFYTAIEEGRKTFEFRKDDRNFQVGDILILKEYDPRINSVGQVVGGNYTGREMRKKITYKLGGGSFGLPEGLCVLSIKDEE